ncbi:MAG: serine/threonine-protein kinase, partial [Myxococcota bacterium]
MTALEAGHRIDRYEVVRPLGQGGMAAVVEVRHVDLGTRHALKVLQLYAPWLHERLIHEGRIQALLRSPHVCRVTDVVRVGDAPGLVMELVDGPSLEVMLASYQPNLDQIDHLARGILAGVEAAHAAGLVHRDLKPGNVLLEVCGAEVVAKVADFGLAKTLHDALDTRGNHTTRSGTTLGSPSYMAPEQFRDAKRADRRADLFSVGCVLYELIAGMRPFDGETPLEVYQRTSSGVYRPLQEVAPNVPTRMAAAIARALAPDPHDRWPDCAALRAAWTDGTDDGALAAVWEPSHVALLRSLGPNAPAVRSTVSIVGRPLPAPIPWSPTVPDAPGSTILPPSGSLVARLVGIG